MSTLSITLDKAFLRQFKYIWIAFSGGLDSTVLLHWLSQHKQIKHKLKAIHFNHQISPQADNWAKANQYFCKELNIPYQVHTPLNKIDPERNIEEQARKARYECFDQLVSAQDCLVLGHHQADQAERRTIISS